MTSFHLIILTPKGIYLDKEVQEIYLKTSKGYMAVLAHHAKLVAKVETSAGFIVINNKREYYAFFSGILNVKKDCTELILNNIENSKLIDVKRANASLLRAKDRLAKKDPNIDLIRAEAALKRAIARINASSEDLKL